MKGAINYLSVAPLDAIDAAIICCILTSEFASGKNFSNHSVPLNWLMKDGNGVGGGGVGVGVGSLGGGGVLQSVKERMLWVERGWTNLVDENGAQTRNNKPLQEMNKSFRTFGHFQW